MSRITIFLPDDIHDRLRREALDARVSVSHVIRGFLERGSLPQAPRRHRDPLAKVEGIVRDGHLSHGIDEPL